MTSKIIKDKLKKPYFDNGKTFFSTRKKAGVYLIYRDNTLLYVGYSGSDVYKAMYRHFQKWQDKKQIRITYNPETVKVRVIYCNNATTASRLETALIINKKPKDNPQQYWLKYDTDEKENAVYNIYLDTDVTPIHTENSIEEWPF